MTLQAITGADVFDGTTLHRNAVLILRDGVFAGIAEAAPDDSRLRRLDGGTLVPGFVDLQVNGGGGVMFNDAPDVARLRRMAGAHAGAGTRALLPTLITDRPAVTRAAIAAVRDAIAEGVPGILGLHLEGPHLSVARKGAHDGALIRPMRAQDLELLCAAAGEIPNLMVTVAPETVTPAQIDALARAGVIVSLGHSDCSFEVARRAIDAGARCVTHLFNAMSQLGSRAPGLAGAALDDGRVSVGLIADGVHVHPATMRAAVAAKRGPGRVFLVSDAMAPAGTDIDSFMLMGRRVLRRDGRLTLEDGTLAGADLTLARAVGVMTGTVGLPLADALAMATSAPADVLRDAMGFGRFARGCPPHAIHLGRDGTVAGLQGALIGPSSRGAAASER